MSNSSGTHNSNSLWSINPYSITTNQTLSVSPESNASLNVKGDIQITGNIYQSNGNELFERLATIERLLSIPPRNPELEKKHPELKQLHQDYMSELEKTLKEKNARLTTLSEKYMLELEKYTMWENLKK